MNYLSKEYPTIPSTAFEYFTKQEKYTGSYSQYDGRTHVTIVGRKLTWPQTKALITMADFSFFHQADYLSRFGMYKYWGIPEEIIFYGVPRKVFETVAPYGVSPTILTQYFMKTGRTRKLKYLQYGPSIEKSLERVVPWLGVDGRICCKNFVMPKKYTAHNINNGVPELARFKFLDMAVRVSAVVDNREKCAYTLRIKNAKVWFVDETYDPSEEFSKELGKGSVPVEPDLTPSQEEEIRRVFARAQKNFTKYGSNEDE